MPNVAQVISLARVQWNASVTQISDTMMLEYFNNVYHDIENDLVRYVNEDFYYDVQYADLIANQTEYIVPLSTSTVSGFKKITDIGLKYTNDWYNVYSYDVWTKRVVLTVAYPDLSLWQTVTFVNKEWYTIWTDTVATINVAWLDFTLTTGIAVLTNQMVLQTRTGIEYVKWGNVSTSNMDKDENIYRNNQPAQQPLYKISDNSIRLYPVATEYVANGLKIYTIRDQVDLSLTSSESDIKIPRQYHNYIASGMLVWMYQQRQMYEEKQIAEAKRSDKKDDLIKDLSNRNISPLEASLPPLRQLG